MVKCNKYEAPHHIRCLNRRPMARNGSLPEDIELIRSKKYNTKKTANRDPTRINQVHVLNGWTIANTLRDESGAGMRNPTGL